MSSCEWQFPHGKRGKISAPHGPNSALFCSDSITFSGVILCSIIPGRIYYYEKSFCAGISTCNFFSSFWLPATVDQSAGIETSALLPSNILSPSLSKNPWRYFTLNFTAAGFWKEKMGSSYFLALHNKLTVGWRGKSVCKGHTASQWKSINTTLSSANL